MRPEADSSIAANAPMSERIHAALRQQIMSCELVPGASLDAGQIAERYGVSRTPVRDAMQRLAAEGLVTILPRSGYLVTPITFEAVHEILDMRAAIGPHIARQAARHASPAEVEALRALLAEYHPGMAIGEMQQVARRFHLAIARLGRNKRLVALSETLFDELERLLRFAIDFTVKVGEHSAEHGALIDAIAAGDGALAAQIEAEHIRHSRDFLIERLMVLGYFSAREVRSAPQTRSAGE